LRLVGIHHQSQLALCLQTARTGHIHPAMQLEMGREGAFAMQTLYGIA